MSEPRAQEQPAPLADWESFYASYRKPGYVPGFEITTKLGGGMFGLVFKATKQSIGKDYAIKFLKVDDGEVRRAVLAELEMVRHFAQVDHPNLVSIEDKGEVDGIPYLVMAYAGAETLRNLLPGDAGSREETLRLFLQACRGVAALHEKSLVHFDLKPANVFLKGGVARVGDYGLSKLVTHSRGSLSMGRGTPYYMAPEMLQRRGDHRSDVYSLGVMLFEVLTGEVPFKGDSEWEVLRKHERGQIEFPPQVTAQQRAIVARCMHKDPEQRFQSVHDLLAAFGASASVGAAAFLDARLDVSSSRVSPPPPPPLSDRPEQKARPAAADAADEDPYATLRKASREAYASAGKIAREAMQNANVVARKAAEKARQQMQAAMKKSRGQHVRRAHAWVRLQRMQRSRSQREREIRRAERRAAQAGVLRTLVRALFAFAIAAVVIVVLLVPAGGPVPQASEVTISASSPVLMAPADTVVIAVAAVPDAFVGTVRRDPPRWAALAQRNPEVAKTELETNLARFRAQMVRAHASGRRGDPLPIFGPVQVRDPVAWRQASESVAALQKVWDPAIAATATKTGVDALVVAAEVLRANVGDGITEPLATIQRNMQRLLVEGTGFDGIALTDDPRMPPMDRLEANRSVGTMWLWFLHEFGWTDATWAAYRELRSR